MRDGVARWTAHRQLAAAGTSLLLGCQLPRVLGEEVVDEERVRELARFLEDWQEKNADSSEGGLVGPPGVSAAPAGGAEARRVALLERRVALLALVVALLLALLLGVALTRQTLRRRRRRREDELVTPGRSLPGRRLRTLRSRGQETSPGEDSRCVTLRHAATLAARLTP